MDDISPIAVFLVKSGSKGDKMLLRYPYRNEDKKETSGRGKRQNPYSLLVAEDYISTPWSVPTTNQSISSSISGFPDDDLTKLFAVTYALCGKKFEVKVNDIRFVGHPTVLNGTSNREHYTVLMFNIVFALKADASHAIVNCYHDLSHRLAIALEHEERRCNYLTIEAKKMLAAHDEIPTLPEDSKVSPYKLILERCQLAKDLATVYQDLRTSGSVHIRINKWIVVSFCLPHKVHYLHNKDIIIEPETIQHCLKSLRPYHGILLLVDVNELLESLPQDASPALIRLVKVTTPMKSLQQLSADADLTLCQVFQLVGHLIYWAKAMVIYPLCESNVYCLSPNAPTYENSLFVEAFQEKFSGTHLLEFMMEFSLPISLSQLTTPLMTGYQQKQQVQMVVWMLQHRLLMQLHTYVYLLCTNTVSPFLNETSVEDPSCRKISHEECLYQCEISHSYQSDDFLLNSPSPSGDPFSDGLPKSASDEELSQRETSSNASLSYLDQCERECILKVPAANIPDDLKLFSRLLPYFRGRHHLEEIMYYENIRRSQLLTVLDKFRPVLVTCQHEDPAVASFYRTS